MFYFGLKWLVSPWYPMRFTDILKSVGTKLHVKEMQMLTFPWYLWQQKDMAIFQVKICLVSVVIEKNMTRNFQSLWHDLKINFN